MDVSNPHTPRSIMSHQSNDDEFRERAEVVRNLLGGRLRHMLAAARDLANSSLGAHRAESWFLLNLATCLTNRNPDKPSRHNGVLERSADFVVQASYCSDVGDKILGDMIRDRVRGITRFAPEHLDLAWELVDQVAGLHALDNNRLACLEDTRGCLGLAKGNAQTAVESHRQADRAWRGLAETGGQIDVGWMGTNLIHWLRAMVALDKSTHAEGNNIADLVARIKREQPGQQARKARILCSPGGLALFRYGETHRY